MLPAAACCRRCRRCCCCCRRRRCCSCCSSYSLLLPAPRIPYSSLGRSPSAPRFMGPPGPSLHKGGFDPMVTLRDKAAVASASALAAAVLPLDGKSCGRRCCLCGLLRGRWVASAGDEVLRLSALLFAGWARRRRRRRHALAAWVPATSSNFFCRAIQLFTSRKFSQRSD